MATSSNMFTYSGGSGASYLTPAYWNKQIEQYARRAIVMQPMGITDTRLMAGDGRIIYIAKNVELESAALTEGIATGVTSLSFGQVNVTVGEHGLAVQVSKLDLGYSFESTMNDIAMNMGYAIAKEKDLVIYKACTSGAYATTYSGGVTSGTMTSGNTFNTDLIANGITAMRTRDREPKYLLIHPNQEGSLLKNSNFINAATYGGREVILNGEVGRYLGLTVISNNIVMTQSTALYTNATAYAALLIGPRPFVVAEKWMPELKSREDSVLDRAVTMAVDCCYGVSVLNSESIQILSST